MPPSAQQTWNASGPHLAERKSRLTVVLSPRDGPGDIVNTHPIATIRASRCIKSLQLRTTAYIDSGGHAPGEQYPAHGRELAVPYVFAQSAAVSPTNTVQALSAYCTKTLGQIFDEGWHSTHSLG
ncbi:MAG TPA: hypothetical protein VFW73_11780 [Lacipirellulaceae bacterium]|nr:hypothetical protein [Lacipirellulaceae bacterium]